MKALRKSLNKDQYSVPPQHHISSPLPSISKPSAAVNPPQKVIRATAPYRSTAPQELSFSKGDFFYVVKEVNDHGSWYEAHNPMTGARGIVPRAMFEEFNKGAAPARSSQSMSPISSPVSGPPGSRISTQSRTQTFFAIVMHDFQAERTDELDAKAGDAVTVVAQSNREWFVAKPIGRLGKPGLIPVSFVQVRDPVTNQAIENVEAIMDSGSLPRVEDWKKQVMSYKAAAIPLGTLDDPTSSAASEPAQSRTRSQSQSLSRHPYSSSAPPSEAAEPAPMHDIDEDAVARPGPPRSDSLASSPTLPDGLLLSANVTSFHYENDDYWFRIHAVYQPFDAAGTTSLPPARDLTLFRAYNDFFDFQTKLLQIFPAEGGQTSPPRRILPYMPGPAERVDSHLSARRREELDDYVGRLARLNRTKARYVLEHRHVRSFFAARSGDLDKGAGPQFELMSSLNWYDPVEEPEVMTGMPDGADVEDEEDLERRDVDSGVDADEELRERFREVERGTREPSDDASDYGDNGYAQSRTNGHGHLHAHKLSTSSSSRTPSPRGHHAAKASVPSVYGRDSAYSSASSNSRVPSKPPISASNPSPAFVKIKVFDRVQDDLIALRVHPRGTLDELLDKVRQRLGDGVASLRFREGGGGGESYVVLEDDDELARWIEGTERHVLYAD